MSSSTIVLQGGFPNSIPQNVYVAKEVEVATVEISSPSTSHFKIATLVFFDVETTGLAAFIGKKNVRITEISMIAVDRDDFSKCQYPDLRDVRIVNKMSLCIKPLYPVSPVAAKITGLSNENLLNQEPFDKNTAVAINAFFSHLPKPVCLLAHNGNVFDFPLLKSEFKKLRVKLPPHICFADTLSAIKSIGIPALPPNPKTPEIKHTKGGGISLALENLHVYFYGESHSGNHSSEGDCIALAKVCHKLRDQILPWCDINYKSLDNISPMW